MTTDAPKQLISLTGALERAYGIGGVHIRQVHSTGVPHEFTVDLRLGRVLAVTILPAQADLELEAARIEAGRRGRRIVRDYYRHTIHTGYHRPLIVWDISWPTVLMIRVRNLWAAARAWRFGASMIAA